MSLALNQRLFEYRIVRVLGQGGFGTVYLAHDTLLDRPVAIKELTITAQTDEVAFKRFVQEARVAGGLSHPHVVTVYALKVVEPHVYLAMEYLAGGSLRALLEQCGFLPVEQAVRIAADVCEGLAAAHAKGIVHRDVKPENILLTEDGRAKVGDFGIAHVPRGTGGTYLSQLTGTGFQPGTLLYMSPEQIRGQQVDGRSDAYQVGALLYEMLMGRHYVDMDALGQQARETAGSNVVLFQARLYELLAEAVCQREPVGVCRVLPNVPGWVGEAVAAALAKEVRRRPTAEAFAEALRNKRRTVGGSDKTAPSSGDREVAGNGHRIHEVVADEWRQSLDQLDGELRRLEALMSYGRYLIASLPQGNTVIMNAQARELTVGQIPLQVLNKLDSVDWEGGTQDWIVHLQLIWRLYLTFYQRCVLKSIQQELVKSIQFPLSGYGTVLSNLRGMHRTIYSMLEEQGVNPYALDQMLDQDVDLVEWLLELRLWHYISVLYDQDALRSEGLYQWWLAEKKVADEVTAEPPQPIGHPIQIHSDLAVLQHGIHDTKIRSAVVMGIVAAYNPVSLDTVTQLLARLKADSALDSPTLEKTVVAMHLALESVAPRKGELNAAVVSAIASLRTQGSATSGIPDSPRRNEQSDALSEWQDYIEDAIPFAAEEYFNQGVAYYEHGCLEKAISVFETALQIAPDYAEAHNNLGVAYEQQGRLDEAVREYQAALRINPGDAMAHYNLGVAYGQRGRPDEAIREYQAALRINPDFAEVHLNLGVAYGQQGRLDEAVRECQAALRINPDFAGAHLNLGMACGQQGRLDEAIREYQAALRINPDLAEAHLNLGTVYGQQGLLDDAIREFQTVLRIAPGSAKAHYILGVAYEQQGRLDEAIRELQAALRIKPDHAEAHNDLGLVYMKQGRLDNAAREFQAALRINPDHAEAHYILGVAYEQQGRLDEAICEYQAALRINPDYAEAHFSLGVVYGQQGHLDEAIREYQAALHIHWDYAKAHYNLGVIYGQQSRLNDEIREYQTALRINPDYAEAHLNLGGAYGQQGRPDDEIREYQAALRINPDFAEAHYDLGVVYHHQGRLDEAIREYQATLRINPNYAEAHHNLGVVYGQQGHRDEAIRELQTAARLGFEPAREMLARMGF